MEPNAALKLTPLPMVHFHHKTRSTNRASLDKKGSYIVRHALIGAKLLWEGTYLGEGSFGEVIQVKHRTEKCDYAVKLMPCIQENERNTKNTNLNH